MAKAKSNKRATKPHEDNGQTVDSPCLEASAPPADSADKADQRAGLDNVPEWWKSPNLIDDIRADIESNGVVGESDNALLTYLIYTSRLLTNPGAVVTRGESSLGKTFVPYRVAELMPAEAILQAMKWTEASLFNTAPNYFKHKIFLSGERKHAQDDETHDSHALMRQFFSEKKISRSVSIPGPDNTWTTKFVTRDGPIAYLESTTSQNIFEEDENRMLQLYLDSSQYQTRSIMLATAGRYDPSRSRPDLSKVFERHHALQRGLQTCDVRIPFWEQLAKLMPANKVKARRVIQQVLTVIESITLLHQYQRDREAGYLLATLDDYDLARRLLMAPLQMSLGVGKEFKKAEKLHAKIGDRKTFTQADVTTAMGYKSKMGAAHLLSSLQESELVECIKKAQGTSAATYGWAALDWNVLPTVEQLQAVRVTE